jgi:hypothetical protein
VVDVVQNTSVTIRTHNLPSNVLFKVKMGRTQGGVNEWIDLPDLDTDRGGTLKTTFSIPAQFSGTSRLVIRLIQNKKNGKTFRMDQWFNNIPGWSGTGGPGYSGYYGYYGYYRWGIPTIWISSVVRNSQVTIRTHNFPPNLTFDVLMGPMGTRGVGGYHVGTLHSGGGGTLTATFNIPPGLHNHYRIAIRTQHLGTGYYSYNWFYNNTTY